MAKKKKAPTWDALVIRTADKDRRSYWGFQWPESGIVECPDWKPTQSCGNGLHGLIDGMGDYGVLSTAHDAVWQVLRVVRSECVEIDGQVKFPRCEVVYSGTMHGALTRMSVEWIRLGIQNKAATVGDDAHVTTAGDDEYAITGGAYARAATVGGCAHAVTVGDGAHASTNGPRAYASTVGSYAHASTAGRFAHASTAGRFAHVLTAGRYARAATAGAKSIAAALGVASKAKAGLDGAIVLSRWDGNRYRLKVGYVGEDIKRDTWYRLNDNHEFEECEG